MHGCMHGCLHFFRMDTVSDGCLHDLLLLALHMAWKLRRPGCCDMCAQVRANALLEVGGSPTWTLTEDYALGMQLKKYGWHCRYVQVLPAEQLRPLDAAGFPERAEEGLCSAGGMPLWMHETKTVVIACRGGCMRDDRVALIRRCACRSTWPSVRRPTRSATATSSARAGARWGAHGVAVHCCPGAAATTGSPAGCLCDGRVQFAAMQSGWCHVADRLVCHHAVGGLLFHRI